jgi:hypothetical protein
MRAYDGAVVFCLSVLGEWHSRTKIRWVARASGPHPSPLAKGEGVTQVPLPHTPFPDAILDLLVQVMAILLERDDYLPAMM